MQVWLEQSVAVVASVVMAAVIHSAVQVLVAVAVVVMLVALAIVTSASVEPVLAAADSVVQP